MTAVRTILVVAACSLALAVFAQAATLEVSQPVQVTDSSYYERGQSVVYDGSHYWLFYGRSATCVDPYSGGNPDISDYLQVLKMLLSRETSPVKNLPVETINQEPAADSPYRDCLEAVFQVARDGTGLRLFRRY